ncbi:MAG: PadR family transcriptional regulator [Mycoplasmatales bacterium]
MNNQFKKGIIEICILKFINEEDRYGYEIVRELEELLEINSSTVYPILKRLKNDKFVDTYLVESESGPARKYYKMTTLGQTELNTMIQAWFDFSNIINKYLSSN